MADSSEPEVLLIDQERINEFGRLNNRLLEIRADLKQYKSDLERLDDSVSELMLGLGDKVKLFLGEAFIEVSEEYATEYCNKKQEWVQQKIDSINQEEKAIQERHVILKKELYAKFGNSINLET